jgi:hypothetical protein
MVWLRAEGAEGNVRPRRLIGRFQPRLQISPPDVP